MSCLVFALTTLPSHHISPVVVCCLCIVFEGFLHSNAQHVNEGTFLYSNAIVWLQETILCCSPGVEETLQSWHSAMSLIETLSIWRDVGPGQLQTLSIWRDAGNTEHLNGRQSWAGHQDCSPSLIEMKSSCVLSPFYRVNWRPNSSEEDFWDCMARWIWIQPFVWPRAWLLCELRDHTKSTSSLCVLPQVSLAHIFIYQNQVLHPSATSPPVVVGYPRYTIWYMQHVKMLVSTMAARQCRRSSRIVPYKGTFVPYDGTYGAPD